MSVIIDPAPLPAAIDGGYLSDHRLRRNYLIGPLFGLVLAGWFGTSNSTVTRRRMSAIGCWRYGGINHDKQVRGRLRIVTMPCWHGPDGRERFVPSDYDNADYDNAAIFARRRNIERYKELLETYLTDHERRYVEQRLAEEQTALQGKVGVDDNAD